MSEDAEAPRNDFLRKRVREDLDSGRVQTVVTRFPPEPNGYLHVGHSQNIALNFDLAAEFGGRCHLRFDDTNPLAESPEFVAAQQEDIRWLGYDWGEHLYFASNYFERLYETACHLVRNGAAYVCDLSSEEIEARRGTLTQPGEPSPYRTRSAEENLDLFQRMRAGEFPPGSRVLRARIDMASPVLPMRDPILYRVLDAPHHRTGADWPIYPLYDFAHSLSDAFEGITHSICTLEFIDRRPLYEWVLEQAEIAEPRPQQIEVAPLLVTGTVMSKRLLRRLIQDGLVAGWDDPRLPTLRGMRRRGYPPEALCRFARTSGVSRTIGFSQQSRLEHEVRAELNERAPRALGVLRPLRVVIDNYPEDHEEDLVAVNNPQDEAAGTRNVPFSRELWIERDDFMRDPPKKFHRMAPGREVRLRFAYLVTCTDVVLDDDGEVAEVHCTYDPETRGGDAPDGRKVRGTLHWVSARHAVAAEARLYAPLFQSDDPLAAGDDFLDDLNPDSLEVVDPVWVEPGLEGLPAGTQLQLERLGYFTVDPDSQPGRPVLDRTVTLRDTWSKIAARSGGNPPQG